MRTKPVKLVVGTLVLLLAGIGCGKSNKPQAIDTAGAEKLAAAAATNPAAILRSQLDTLLGQHVALAAAATGALLGGRKAEADAAVSRLLGQNSSDIAKAIGTAYGASAQKRFLPLWQRHIGFFAAYASSLAKNDRADARKAVDDLNAYAQTFGAFLHGLSPSLTQGAVADLISGHAKTLLAVIDAQAAKNFGKVYGALIDAYGHMDMIGEALAVTVVKQFPEKVQGVADSKPADLRAKLDALLQEHVVLTAAATNASLAGRGDEFNAASAALTGRNADDLAGAIGDAYGSDAKDRFLPLWKQHINLFVSYTKAVGSKNKDRQASAIDALSAYSKTFATFLNKLNSDLVIDDVTDLLELHVLTIKSVIDAQSRKAYPLEFDSLIRAVAHMDDLALGVADATARKFPDKFI